MHNMYNEKLNGIKDALIRFEKKLLNHREYSYIINSGSPSRHLWSYYNEYMGEIMELFKDSKELKQFSVLYEKVGIESLYISADFDYDESKKKLESYIQQTKKNLLLGD